jgi:hypothetical protein
MDDYYRKIAERPLINETKSTKPKTDDNAERIKRINTTDTRILSR